MMFIVKVKCTLQFLNIYFRQIKNFNKISNSKPMKVDTNYSTFNQTQFVNTNLNSISNQQAQRVTKERQQYQKTINNIPNENMSMQQYFEQIRQKSKSQQKHIHQNFNKKEKPTASLFVGQQGQLGRIVHKLQNRIQGTQIKIASLTNVVKLLQKYTQSKDLQYEKQKENVLYAQIIGDRISMAESLEIENKIKQFNLISAKMKKQYQQVDSLKQELKQSLFKIQNVPNLDKLNNASKKEKQRNLSNNKNPPSPHYLHSYINGQQLAVIIQEMQSRLRQQINRKTDICLKQISKISLSLDEGFINTNNLNNPNTSEQLFANYQDRFNHFNHLISQLENQCLRNKMAIERYMDRDDFINQLPLSRQRMEKLSVSRERNNQNNYVNNNAAVAIRKVQKSQSKDRSSSPSLRNVKKTPVLDKNRQNSKSRKVIDKKKIREEQLLQAINRKKQTKQKLKQKFF